MTGRMSGFDIGDQIKLLALADGVLPTDSYVSLAARMFGSRGGGCGGIEG